MYIDYTNIEKPGGERAASPSPVGSANVIVLSADPALIELSRDCLAENHRVWRADDPGHAADLLVSAGNAVLLADASLADHNTREFITRVHEQFPDISIIVAGRRDDETELADLVSQGVIFRFLHKPASADRIRNFVDATLRRHQKNVDTPAAAPRQTGTTSVKLKALALPEMKFDNAGKQRSFRRGLLLAPLVLIIIVLAIWKPWQQPGNLTPPDGGQSATADASRDAAVQKLLEMAGLALTRGELVEPPERNALELYRAVLARDPRNRAAERGIDQVADALLLQAEKALMAQDLAGLASAVDAARSARPDHPRLEFFETQLERELARSPNSGKLPRSAGAQAGTAPASGPAGAFEETSRVQSLVTLANERMRGNQLVDGNDSALAYLISARRIDSADPAVQQSVAALASLLRTNAHKAIGEGRLDDANDWLLKVVALDADRPEVAELRSELEAARLGSVREDRARLFSLVNQRIAQGRLIEPVADSAAHYLDLLRASDPGYAGLPETSALLADKALEESRRLAAAGSINESEAMLKAANDAGAPAVEAAAVATEIAEARAALLPPKPAAPAVLPEGALHRKRFVKPNYPPRALQQGIAGWVDIEFTVASDGSTRDATVRAAEPTGVFDRAALDSVARWRYEPRVIDGVVVEQRVAARVRFEITD